MPISKPFYRTVRGMKDGPNSGYSGWAYIEDQKYADSPGHYTRALLLILDDLRAIFEFVEPSDEGREAFSYRIHALLMRTCIEIEANFKAILDANSFTPPVRRPLSIRDFRKIDATHHLSSYEAMLPMWNGASPTIRPFEPWRSFRGEEAPQQGVPLPWYQAYNASKHSRRQAFKRANLWTLIEAVTALLIVVTSQFKTSTFEAGPDHLITSGENYYPHEESIGSMFRIKYPDDWEDEEIYDFNWSSLKMENDRFGKIDYDSIPI
ncbi:hypothetical protein ACKU27_01505 [Sphingobium yanoikuyae]|jgi:hypothetical protein|uniref:hypothetical protein n=1 Tax=Sphingobium yanoikuyae TaxID=13690 RepID=UPI002FDE90D8